MSTLRHPRLPNVTVDVIAGDEDRFKAQGWVSTEPTPEPEPTPEAEGEPEDSVEDVDEKPKRRRK